jgi:Helix-turn-helix domain
MSIASDQRDRIAMRHRERDRLRVLRSVLDGQRTQAEAARLLRLTPRRLRRLLQRLQQGGDAALVHPLRGQPSNHRKDAKLRRRVLQVYRKDFADFGPPYPLKFSAGRADASGKRRGLGLHEGNQALWRTAQRWALGSHFRGALSSRRRRKR